VRLGGGVQRTPSGKIRQRSKSRTKMGTRDRKETWLTQGRLHIDLWLRWINGVRISCSIPRVLNPSRLYYHPLNFQPPSPPRTIAQAAVEPTPIEMATPKGKIKEPTSTGRKNHTVSLASALSAFDMHTLSPGTLSPAFSSVFIGFYVGASKNTAAYGSVDIDVFVGSYTGWVAFCACVTEQARCGRCGSFAGKAERVVG